MERRSQSSSVFSHAARPAFAAIAHAFDSALTLSSPSPLLAPTLSHARASQPNDIPAWLHRARNTIASLAAYATRVGEFHMRSADKVNNDRTPVQTLAVSGGSDGSDEDQCEQIVCEYDYADTAPPRPGSLADAFALLDEARCIERIVRDAMIGVDHDAAVATSASGVSSRTHPDQVRQHFHHCQNHRQRSAVERLLSDGAHELAFARVAAACITRVRNAFRALKSAAAEALSSASVLSLSAASDDAFASDQLLDSSTASEARSSSSSSADTIEHELNRSAAARASSRVVGAIMRSANERFCAPDAIISAMRFVAARPLNTPNNPSDAATGGRDAPRRILWLRGMRCFNCMRAFLHSNPKRQTP
jgi:hypothetical protein